MSDPLIAITRQDADDLSRILQSGWEPPRIRAKFSTMPDHAAWTEVVLRDWVEGLTLLDQHYPQITRHTDIWRIALRNASHRCLNYLWTALGLSADQFSLADRQDCVIALSAAMGEPWSPSYEIRDIQPVLSMFATHGVNLDAVAPGEFEVGDFRIAGHSLFTRALATRRWDVVLSTWPDPNCALPDWPRLDEVLLSVFDVVGGNYRPLMLSSSVEAKSRLEPVRFQQLYFKPGSFQQSGVVDDRFLVGWIEDFHAQWPSTQQTLLDALVMPSSSQVSPWLRFPMMIDTLLSTKDFQGNARQIPSELSPQALRQPVWATWRRVLSDDRSGTWLRALAADPLDEDVKTLLSLMQQEAPDLLAQHWDTPSPEDGLSPADVWRMQGGTPVSAD